MDGGMVWVGIIFAILAVSLLAAVTSGKRRRHSQVTAAGEPSLAQAARDFARLRYLGHRGYRRRG